MKSIKLIGLALGASLALSTTALAQDITIAVAGPMTGSESAFGRQMKNGGEQAVADLNAAGGVLGKKLALEVGDDACDPKQARSVAEKFASAKVPFVAGHYCSSSSIPASEAYADGNVLQITPASRSQPSAFGGGEIRQRESPVRCRPLLLVVVDPGIGSLCRR